MIMYFQFNIMLRNTEIIPELNFLIDLWNKCMKTNILNLKEELFSLLFFLIIIFLIFCSITNWRVFTGCLRKSTVKIPQFFILWERHKNLFAWNWQIRTATTLGGGGINAAAWSKAKWRKDKLFKLQNSQDITYQKEENTSTKIEIWMWMF